MESHKYSIEQFISVDYISIRICIKYKYEMTKT